MSTEAFSGTVPYVEMLERQHAAVHARREVIWGLQHSSVVTTGRRPVEDLSGVHAAGIPVVATGRGGLATWHGPGQLVVYPILDLELRQIRIRDHVQMLEQVVIAWLRSHGVPAGTDPRGVGVWCAGEKIASIGVRVRRGMVFHGLAINLVNDLTPYETFDPCGLGARMTRASDHGCDLDPAAAWPGFARELLAAVDTLTALN